MRKRIGNIIQSSLLAMLALVGMVSCEVIPEGDRFIPIDVKETNRTTLLIEFSGLRCMNCPNAAEEAHDMLSLYGDNLLVVEMHPKSNSMTHAKAEWDYTCEASDTYYTYFGGSSTTPFPTGVINMTPAEDGKYFLEYPLWGAAYQESASKISHIDIQQAVRYDASSRTVVMDAYITNLSTIDMKVQHIVWLTEDSIVGPQVMPDGSQNKEYVHNHVLRDAITDVWGDSLAITAGATEIVTLDYPLPEKVNPTNCNIISLVLKDKEVIQAKEYKIKNSI